MGESNNLIRIGQMFKKDCAFQCLNNQQEGRLLPTKYRISELSHENYQQKRG